MKKFEYKVPGGKLVRVKVETEAGKITSLQISGDFFLLPETDLEELEEILVGVGGEDMIERTVVSFFSEKKTTIVGASPENFAYVINTAISS